MSAGILPDFAEGTFLDVAQAPRLRELIRMDIALGVDIPDARARAVVCATIPPQESASFFRTFR